MASRHELTGAALEALLRLFGPDREAAGRAYEEVRRRLVRLFEWRGLSRGDELADETLTRAARRLVEGVSVEGGAYAYMAGIARLVALEEFRRRDREQAAAADPRARPEAAAPEDAKALACLDRCLDTLSARNRGLVISYYEGEGRARIASRARMARDLGIAEGTLRVRVLRIRESLAGCTRDCLTS